MATRFKKVKPNEWQLPIMNGYKMACCDCGLVHNVTFKAVDEETQKKIKGGRVLMKANRNIRLTKDLRKKNNLYFIKK